MNSNFTCTGRHTIEAGDTLYSIAAKYEIPIHTILFCNKFLNPYNLQVGEVISIPVYPSHEDICGPNGQSYIIRPGDTIYFIANRLEISVDELMRLNPGIDPYNLMPGMQICVTRLNTPVPPIAPPPGPSNPPVAPLPDMPNMPVPPIAPPPGPSNPPVAPLPGMPNMPVPPIAPPPGPNNPPVAPLPGMPNIPMPPIAPPPGPNNPPVYPGPSMPPNRPNRPNMPNYPNNNCNGKFYTVRRGDTLTKILTSYNYSYAALLHSNPDIDFTLLQPGMRLCIPKMDSFNGCPGKTTYIIKQGDTLSKLATSLKVTTDALLMSNPSLKPTDFSMPGTKICVPEQGVMPL